MMSIGPKICIICLDSIVDNFEKNSVIDNLTADNKILRLAINKWNHLQLILFF